MSRYFLRIAIAILCFAIGLFGAWASGYWKSFESFVVENFSDEPIISFSCLEEFNRIERAKEVEETKAVYKRVICGRPEFGFVNKKSEDYYALFRLNESGKTEEERTIAFITNIQKIAPNIENSTLISFLNKSKITDLLEGVPKQEVKSFDEKPNGLADYINCNSSFSNVGFNSERTQAFVYMEYHSWNYRDYQFAFLIKQNGKWIIANKIPIRMSGSHIFQ